MPFSENTLKALQRARWKDKEYRDIAKALDIMQREGFPILTAVVAFLRRFNGIHVTGHYSVYQGYDFIINIEDRLDNILEGRIFELSQETGIPLCPIGSMDGIVLLLMDDAGRVYMYLDANLIRIAQTGEEAIEGMCQHRINNEFVYNFMHKDRKAFR